MFNPRELALGAARRAPQFLAQRVGSVMDGICLAYVWLLFFFGGLSYTSTIASIVVVGVVYWATGRLFDRMLRLVADQAERVAPRLALDTRRSAADDNASSAAAQGPNAAANDEKEKLD